jgi:hypothetical protein
MRMTSAIQQHVDVQTDVVELELRRCPRCERWLPISNFGVCRARKDGRNLYCALCIREKVNASRQRFREYKKARVAVGLAPLPASVKVYDAAGDRRVKRMVRKISSHEDRVREAIALGKHTLKEIAVTTKLSKDSVCDALANLLLWSGDIRTQIVKGQRMYFINETPGIGPPRRRIPRREPEQSYGISHVYNGTYGD